MSDAWQLHKNAEAERSLPDKASLAAPRRLTKSLRKRVLSNPAGAQTTMPKFGPGNNSLNIVFNQSYEQTICKLLNIILSQKMME